MAEKRRDIEYQNSLEGRAVAIIGRKRAHARNKGLDFDLNKNWMLARLKYGCEITHLPYKFHACGTNSQRGGHPFSPSIDRINPLKGYTKDNCRLILNCINMFKGTMNDSQVLEIAEQLYLGLADRLLS